jgi:hypothetical protein
MSPGCAEAPTDCRELPHKLYLSLGEVRGEVPESLANQGIQIWGEIGVSPF